MTELERNIVQGCLRGDKSSQKQLYNQYSQKMYSVCLRYSQNTDQAKDFLQEGFIRVFQNLTSFKGEGSFEGWIRRIMINGCLEALRKPENRLFYEDVETIDAEMSYTPDMRKLDVQYILRKIQELAPGYRAVFNLYVLEGYQHQEIAEMLDISESTSKSQLSRARKLLQEMLSGEFSNIHEQ
ncbi:MAG: sigma-70 family RNA polymerase sigma factor [Bacteroidetes bacterium]|nr:sigma-70 family RNA polymerase sigma factor [Bacteroidota bacterium]